VRRWPGIAGLALAGLLAANPVAAAAAEGQGTMAFPMPAVSFGFSYPLIVSLSAGAFLPLGAQDPNDVFPSVPSLRADVELGLGGGGFSGGTYLPFGEGAFALNLKAARLRTWLIDWHEPVDRTYDGAVVELVALGHVPGKIGAGYFKDRAPVGDRRDAFVYFFVGVGW
jgi:hypothetical protein